MSDALKLSLARAIHGTPEASRPSFSPTQWAGVERAWEWIGKNYQPKEPPMKQEHVSPPPVPSVEPPAPAPDREALARVPAWPTNYPWAISADFTSTGLGAYRQSDLHAALRTRDERIAELTKERDELWAINRRLTEQKLEAYKQRDEARGKRSVTMEELSGAMADVFGSYHRRTIERTDMENAILRHLCS